ncbi:Protein strawberry notch [Trichinella pseudospiralis]
MSLWPAAKLTVSTTAWDLCPSPVHDQHFPPKQQYSDRRSTVHTLSTGQGQLVVCVFHLQLPGAGQLFLFSKISLLWAKPKKGEKYNQ